METRVIFIREGYWYCVDDYWSIPGLYVRKRFKLAPTDGGSVPRDGQYRGFVPVQNLLRIVWGGEYFCGATINQSFLDFQLEFDDEYYDTYLAGLLRGYNGKRACHYNYFIEKPLLWRDGYEDGREARQRLSRSESLVA